MSDNFFKNFLWRIHEHDDSLSAPTHAVVGGGVVKLSIKTITTVFCNYIHTKNTHQDKEYYWYKMCFFLLCLFGIYISIHIRLNLKIHIFCSVEYQNDRRFYKIYTVLAKYL